MQHGECIKISATKVCAPARVYIRVRRVRCVRHATPRLEVKSSGHIARTLSHGLVLYERARMRSMLVRSAYEPH